MEIASDDMLPMIGIMLTIAYIGASLVLERTLEWLRHARGTSIDVQRRSLLVTLRCCLLIEIAVALMGIEFCPTPVNYGTVALGTLTAASWSMVVVHRAHALQRAYIRRFS